MVVVVAVVVTEAMMVEVIKRKIDSSCNYLSKAWPRVIASEPMPYLC